MESEWLCGYARRGVESGVIKVELQTYRLPEIVCKNS